MPEVVTIGGGNKSVSVYGPHASVYAGGGNDTIFVHGKFGFVRVGGGEDQIHMYQGGKVTESGIHGHDTIHWGTGKLDVAVHGKATVFGSHGGQEFVVASIAGGEAKFQYSHNTLEEIAVKGKLTLIGGDGKTEFIGGSGGHTVMVGVKGYDTFVGGSGHDTMYAAAGGHNLFEFLKGDAGGKHVIEHFLHGDKLYLEGHSLNYLESHHDITTKDGNTYIKLDDGKTTIELKGFTGLDSSDITHHK